MLDDLDRMEQEEREREHREAREALAREQREKDVRELLALPAGRRYLWALIDGRCGLHSGSMTDSDRWTFYNEGRRSIGREVMQELQAADAKGYLLMLTEQLPKETP